MMKSWCSRRVWMASVVLLCLSAATAWAAESLTNISVPGVDSTGNPNGGVGTSLLLLKITYNTEKGTFTASGKSTVPNLYLNDKGKPQKVEFLDPPFKVQVPSLFVITSVLYKVDKKGKCSFNASGYLDYGP